MGLDQYYTAPEVARRCFDELTNRYDLTQYDRVLEPSAGTGSFFLLLPEHNRVGIDLDPKCDGLVQQDFFDYWFEPGLRYFAVGNPPFGRNASLAVRFFNRCAEFCEGIAFVVPRTFRKKSVINRLDPWFHLSYEHILAERSFLRDDRPYDVPCVFQIWQKQVERRAKQAVLKQHDDFVFVPREEADIALQRVGVRAGLIRETGSFETISAESHFFIKFVDADSPAIFAQIDFAAVKFDTAGNPSVSRSELIELYQATKANGLA